MSLISSLVLAAFVGWTGVDKDDYLGGRKVSAGYLQGKVVLVNKWGADAESRGRLSRLEQVWSSFKSKQFVLLGSYCGNDGASARQTKSHGSLAIGMERSVGDGVVSATRPPSKSPRSMPS